MFDNDKNIIFIFKVPMNEETSSSLNQNGNPMQSSSATLMTNSNLSYDTEEMFEKQSDDDNLENLRKKVSSLIIDTVSSNSSNKTIIHKSPMQSSDTYTYRSELSEKNNNMIDSENSEDEYDVKKIYLVRSKRYEILEALKFQICF